MAGIRDYSVIASGFIGVTAGKQVVAAPTGAIGAVGPGGVAHGVFLISDGTNACNCIIYHGTAATSGNELAKLSIPATTVAPQNIIFNNPVACPDGIFITVTGTGSNAVVYYSVGA